MLGTALVIKMRSTPCTAESLNRLPKILIDDPQFRYFLTVPFAFRVFAGNTFACGGIL